jgi:hypothetical protein
MDSLEPILKAMPMPPSPKERWARSEFGSENTDKWLTATVRSRNFRPSATGFELKGKEGRAVFNDIRLGAMYVKAALGLWLGAATFSSATFTMAPDGDTYVAGGPRSKVRTVTGAYPATAYDDVILANANITITLPTAVSRSGKRYTIKKITATAGTVTIDTTSSQTIDGVTSKTLTTQYEVLRVASDGANWHVL